MEDSKKEWKNFVILRQGGFWVVRNHKRFVGGRFTTRQEAERYINRRREEYKRYLMSSGLLKIRRMPIKIRKKEYEKLCQTIESI